MPCTDKNKNEQLPAWKTNQQTLNACHVAFILIESPLEGSERNVGEIGGNMKHENIVCRNEPMVKMMVEYHHAGPPKGFFSIHFCQPPKIHMRYFQALLFHGKFVGLIKTQIFQHAHL